MKAVVVALFASALTCISVAHAAVEIDGYGIYSLPSGALLNQFSALATSYGETAKRGGYGGGGAFLFGKTGQALWGVDVGGAPLISFSTSSASDVVSTISALALARWRPSIFLIDLGVGWTSLAVTGAVNATSSGSDTTLMGGVGISLGGTIGLDAGARAYFFFDSSGTIIALAPFVGIHLLFGGGDSHGQRAQ